jgi:hypothetical protein
MAFSATLGAASPSVEAPPSVYGLFKVVTLLAMLLLQLFATSYLRRLEFKQVFAVMPSTLLLALLLALFLPGLDGRGRGQLSGACRSPAGGALGPEIVPVPGAR